jgi:hypothetical protein
MEKKKMAMLFVTVLQIATIFGCASTSKNEVSKTNDGVKQPDWVTETPSETGDTMFFVAPGGKDGTLTVKSLRAHSIASNELATYINSKTDSLMKNYIESAGETNNLQSLESLRVGIKNRAIANTSGFKRDKQWVSADGEYFGLYSYKKPVFKGDIRAEVDSFKEKAGAAAANLKSDKFFEEMEKDI